MLSLHAATNIQHTFNVVQFRKKIDFCELVLWLNQSKGNSKVLIVWKVADCTQRQTYSMANVVQFGTKWLIWVWASYLNESVKALSNWQVIVWISVTNHSLKHLRLHITTNTARPISVGDMVIFHIVISPACEIVDTWYYHACVDVGKRETMYLSNAIS